MPLRRGLVRQDDRVRVQDLRPELRLVHLCQLLRRRGPRGPRVTERPRLAHAVSTQVGVCYIDNYRRLGVFLGSFGAMAKAFLPPIKKLDETVERMVELAGMARKDGMMALEGQPVPDKFFEKGMQMLVDGADEQKLVKQMKSEIASMKARHEVNQGVVQGWVDVAPAMGMIGTLIGLVLMLGNMGDPKSIGPAMAVALLTTLYGAFVANVLFAPIAKKLEYYTSYEVVYREIVLEGLRGIARSESPRNIQDQMAAALPPKLQSKFELAA